MITVDNRTGIVSVVTSRYVVVRGLTAIEAIVPKRNAGDDDRAQSFVHQQATSRSACPCRSATTATSSWRCGSMTELAATEPRVLPAATLAPVVNVLRFGDNGIDLELAVWINDPENGPGQPEIRALNLGIWKALSRQRHHRSRTRSARFVSSAEPPGDNVADASSLGADR